MTAVMRGRRVGTIPRDPPSALVAAGVLIATAFLTEPVLAVARRIRAARSLFGQLSRRPTEALRGGWRSARPPGLFSTPLMR